MSHPAAPIFHVTHWKAGSQWVRKVLKAAAPGRVIRPTGDATWFGAHSIESGSIYSPIYDSYDRFRSVISADRPQRTFAVIRDARDTAVSWYFSLRYSHTTRDVAIKEPREVLAQLSTDDGLAMVIASHLRTAVWIQRTWLESGAKVFRYEDLRQRPYETFDELLAFCGMDLPERARRKIIDQNSFERKTWWRFGRESKRSHLRKGMPGDWKNYFNARHKQLFRSHYGDILIRAGYEKDNNW